MKVAVTGASGFIGRYVLEELRKHNVELVAATRNAARLKNIGKSICVVEMDIEDHQSDNFEKLGQPDVLIHLAWSGLPNYNSLHHFETELPKQYNFIKRLIQAGLPSLLITGTCFEYGMQSGPLSASMPCRPVNPYGYAKDALRQQLEYLKSGASFNLVWARLFYMYGEGQPSTSLYSCLKEAALRGDETFNMSGGEQLRDYLPVNEVARQIVKLAIAKQTIGVVNICSGSPISVRKLAERWVDENNWKIRLHFGYLPYQNYEPMAFWGEHTNEMRKFFNADSVT